MSLANMPGFRNDFEAEALPALPDASLGQARMGMHGIDLMHPGQAHSAGDIARYKSACYCGDGHFAGWQAACGLHTRRGILAIARTRTTGDK